MHRHRARRFGWKLAYLFVVVALATAGGAMVLLKGGGGDAALTVAGPGPQPSWTPPPTVPLGTTTPTATASPTPSPVSPTAAPVAAPPPAAAPTSNPPAAPPRTVTAAPSRSPAAAPTPTPVVPSVPAPPPSLTTVTFAVQVVTLTNAQRLLGGCAPLRSDPALTSAAQGHSADMAAQGYFDHDGKDGRTPFDRIRAAGYRYSLAGENIAAGQPTPAAVVAGWMASPGHRANIMNCAFRDIGVGYAAGGSYGAYWTQDFGAPAAATR